MNGNTTIHLIRTELRRNLWIIAAFWVSALFVSDIIVGGMVAGLLVARIAQGDHLTRPTAQWKSRPVSLTAWICSRVLLLFFLILLPVTMQQGWISQARGFDAGATVWTMIEVAMVTTIFVTAVFVLATLASNWVHFALLLAGVLTFGAVAGMVVADLCEFSVRGPRGMRSFYTPASYLPRPSVWWITWLGMIAVSLFVLILHVRLRRRVVTHVILGIAISSTVVGIMWAQSTSHRIEIRQASERITLSEYSAGKEATAIQQVFRSIGIRGLADGEFVELKTVRAKGKKDHFHSRLREPGDKSEMEDRSQGQQALVRLLPRDHRVLSAHGFFPAVIREQLDRSVGEAFEDPSIDRVGMGGEVFQWVELGALPIATGGTSLKNDLFCEIRRNPAGGNGGMLSFRLHIKQPTLTLSPSLTENAITGGWQGSDRIAVVATHEELKEALLFQIHTGRSATGDGGFGLHKSVDFGVTIFENPDWKMIWPEGVSTEQWIEGAEFRLYGQEYRGQFEADLDLK